jgi:hypothetical protein
MLSRQDRRSCGRSLVQTITETVGSPRSGRSSLKPLTALMNAPLTCRAQSLCSSSRVIASHWRSTVRTGSAGTRTWPRKPSRDSTTSSALW